eukprot:1194225-Prorocentrum_minimum.AAC.1
MAHAVGNKINERAQTKKAKTRQCEQAKRECEFLRTTPLPIACASCTPVGQRHSQHACRAHAHLPKALHVRCSAAIVPWRVRNNDWSLVNKCSICHIGCHFQRTAPARPLAQLLCGGGIQEHLAQVAPHTLLNCRRHHLCYHLLVIYPQ